MNEQSVKILFVDDDPTVVEGFLGLYKKAFSILTAQNGKEALDYLEKDPDIGVVISDQRMPDIDGTDILFRFKEKNPFITRILITAYADYGDVVEAVNTAEVFYYVKKPYKTEELKEVIQRAINKYKMLKRNAEEEKQLQKLIFERSLEVVQSYTDGIAHHIKNPLVALYSFLDIFSQSKEKNLLDDGMKGLLEVASRDVRRINELIELLSKISQCVLSGFQRINVEKLFELVLSSDIKETLNRKKLNIVKKIAPNLPELYVDVASIKEVLGEILKNAAQASDDEKKIILIVEKLDHVGKLGCLNIEVVDEGKGIEEKDLKRVFDPFFKGTKDPQVKGLGLTYCQFIVLKHGGEMTIESQVGKGTKVSLKLPVIQSGQTEKPIISEEELLEERAKRFLQGRQKFTR